MSPTAAKLEEAYEPVPDNDSRVVKIRQYKARRDHVCEACYTKIHCGETYRYIAYKDYDRKLMVRRKHLACD